MTGSTIVIPPTTSGGGSSVYGELERVNIAGGSYDDIVFGSPVEDVVGYGINIIGPPTSLVLRGILPPTDMSISKDIWVLNEAIFSQTGIIIVNNNAVSTSTSSILTPSGGVYHIRRHESAVFTWSVPHQKWLMQGISR